VTEPHFHGDEHDSLVTHPYRGRGAMRLWVAMLCGPVAWLAAFQGDYARVERACVGRARWPLHLVMGLAVLLTLGGLALSWRLWRGVGRQWPDEAGTATARARFMAMSGLLIGAFFLLLLLAQWWANVVLHPCLA
jgi:hypothetical protein